MIRNKGSICTSGFGIPHNKHTDFNAHTAIEEHLNSFATSGMWEGIETISKYKSEKPQLHGRQVHPSQMVSFHSLLFQVWLDWQNLQREPLYLSTCLSVYLSIAIYSWSLKDYLDLQVGYWWDQESGTDLWGKLKNLCYANLCEKYATVVRLKKEKGKRKHQNVPFQALQVLQNGALQSDVLTLLCTTKSHFITTWKIPKYLILNELFSSWLKGRKSYNN